jgi:hypothetical protein
MRARPASIAGYPAARRNMIMNLTTLLTTLNQPDRAVALAHPRLGDELAALRQSESERGTAHYRWLPRSDRQARPRRVIGTLRQQLGVA